MCNSPIRFHIAVVNGIEIDGKKEEVPFILIYQNDEIEKNFLSHQNKIINLNIVNDDLTIQFQDNQELYQIKLHQDYLRIIRIDKKINFGVLNEDNKILYSFSFNNIGGL